MHTYNAQKGIKGGGTNLTNKQQQRKQTHFDDKEIKTNMQKEKDNNINKENTFNSYKGMGITYLQRSAGLGEEKENMFVKDNFYH